MASSEEVICKKHPNHKQQPGVCSCCLTERLINLSTTISTPTVSSSPISSSLFSYTYYSSLSSSTCDSPRGGRGPGHRRITSDVVVGPFSFVSFIGASAGGGGGLKKSRSIAFVARGGILNGQKKKEGFWSKFIKSTGKISKRVLVH